MTFTGEKPVGFDVTVMRLFINTVPEKNEGIFKEQEKEKNSEWENK